MEFEIVTIIAFIYQTVQLGRDIIYKCELFWNVTYLVNIKTCTHSSCSF